MFKHISWERKDPNETKTSKQWCDEMSKKHNLETLSLRGWDQKNVHYSFYKELVTKSEFLKRIVKSSITCDTSFFKEYWIQAITIPLVCRIDQRKQEQEPQVKKGILRNASGVKQ